MWNTRGFERKNFHGEMIQDRTQIVLQHSIFSPVLPCCAVIIAFSPQLATRLPPAFIGVTPSPIILVSVTRYEMGILSAELSEFLFTVILLTYPCPSLSSILVLGLQSMLASSCYSTLRYPPISKSDMAQLVAEFPTNKMSETVTQFSPVGCRTNPGMTQNKSRTQKCFV